ncbi:chemotaxis protein histidine kinase CheA [Bradyrhizobium sp. LM3.6]
MSAMDPTEVFRQEASELFEVLEGALLDLGLRPDDRELVDSAFRALHTIKGSGAMFGFDKVASFTHEFETAFDRVRKGEIKPTQDLISLALAAKDYIRALIEDPQSTDDVIGEAILDDLERYVFPDQAATAAAEIIEAPLAPAESKQAGWHLYLEFESHVLRNGSNPLDLLEDLCKLGPCFVVPVTDGIPFLDEMEPVRLLSEVGRQAARGLRQGRDRRRLHVCLGRDEADALAAGASRGARADAAVPATRRGAGRGGRNACAGGRGCCARRRAARRNDGTQI